ncbi:hypothetical protein B0A49_10045 [Cryomyces minteri]|uniref:Cell wall mannoprotein PIR1-like C-terminal domain-containing protein n=1 Tax=Cryomyces minteri TaxID=331657 RepID=A0A4U0WYF2_9PEZI|nr:hypothetical protein B0A49_10045 [Cryomyces minteri]
MQYTVALLALAASAFAVPQGVTQTLTPSAPAPSGCSSSYPGTFQVSVVNVTSSSGSKVKRQSSGVLTLSLNNGVLKDQAGRIGYIAANRQYQFDGPPQTGAIYTAGFSVCANNSLALGGSAIWYQCLSGTFYNLYDQTQGKQCNAVYIEAVGGSAAATQSSDGQPAVTSNKASSAAVSQVTDGQVQATTKASSAATKSAAPVAQITDGQIQASSAATKSATKSAAPVSQITDGQIQAATSASKASSAAVISQISDGQPQAPTSSRAVVTQISDGQIQATASSARNATFTSSSAVAVYTGAAAKPIHIGGEFLAGAAAIVGAVAML